MTVAVLVLASKEPWVLSQTAPLYADAGFDVYVHVDAKLLLQSYIDAMGESATYCNFVEPRIEIFWGGYNMIRATISLIEMAMDVKEYTNILLLSDDTIPIVPIERLQSGLSSRIERISLRQVAKKELFFERYQKFFFFDHPATSLIGRPVETAAIDDGLFAVIDRLRARKTIGKVAFPLFYGSQWWCLTSDTIKMFLSKHNMDADIRESFEFSAVPDEIYMQSVVGNFVEANAITHSPVFVDWTRQPRPFVFSSAEELPDTIGPEYLFIRKVNGKAKEFVESMLRQVVAA